MADSGMAGFGFDDRDERDALGAEAYQGPTAKDEQGTETGKAPEAQGDVPVSKRVPDYQDLIRWVLEMGDDMDPLAKKILLHFLVDIDDYGQMRIAQQAFQRAHMVPFDLYSARTTELMRNEMLLKVDKGSRDRMAVWELGNVLRPVWNYDVDHTLPGLGGFW